MATLCRRQKILKQLLLSSRKDARLFCSIGNLPSKEVKGHPTQVELKIPYASQELENTASILKAPQSTFKYLHPNQLELRDEIVSKVMHSFKKYGAQHLQTPVIEIRDHLLKKYSKDDIICHLAPQEEELVSLRPDLKVPLARHMAEHMLSNHRWCQLGKVYRSHREGTMLTAIEETLRADFDITGQYDLMMADAECAMLLVDIFTSLGLKNFVIKVNYKPILDCFLQTCGLSQEDFLRIIHWLKEGGAISNPSFLASQMNLDQKTVEIVHLYTSMCGNELLARLQTDPAFSQNKRVKEGLDSMKLFLKYCDWFDIGDKVEFDLTLTEDLGYYTEILIGASLSDTRWSHIPDVLASGGRYDNLSGKFAPGIPGVPSIGVSLDINRILSILEVQERNLSPRCHHMYHNVLITSKPLNPKPSFKELPKKVKATENQGDEEYFKMIKTPKGTKDYGPEKMALRDEILKKVADCFKRHGAQAIDTPLFEPKEVSEEKYGEEGRLIYDVDGSNLSLRYDLTVPFARFLDAQRLHHFTRYQVGQVYRRDKPYTTRGRLREFFQCDFDIAGDLEPMVADAKCVHVLADVLDTLNIGKYTVKVSHRKILEGLFEVCNVPPDKFRAICSSIDKLGKVPWEEVKYEMVQEKGLDPGKADLLGNYIFQSGTSHSYLDTMRILLDDPKLALNASIQEGVESMQIFGRRCQLMSLDDKVVFDLSLARGLTYYTGIVFEAIITDSSIENASSLGSIAGGGRYDNLVSLVSSNQHSVPCVGVSIGIERIFAVLSAAKAPSTQARTTETEVFVASAHKGLAQERFRIRNLLLRSGFKAEAPLKDSPKFLNQLQYCEKNGIPWVIVLGDSELKKGEVKLRNTLSRQEVDIPQASLINELHLRLHYS